MQRNEGCPADWRTAFDVVIAKVEVRVPIVLAWVEQRVGAAGEWIGGLDLIRFVKVAVRASQRTIFQFRWSAARCRKDVFDVKGRAFKAWCILQYSQRWSARAQTSST